MPKSLSSTEWGEKGDDIRNDDASQKRTAPIRPRPLPIAAMSRCWAALFDTAFRVHNMYWEFPG